MQIVMGRLARTGKILGTILTIIFRVLTILLLMAILFVLYTQANNPKSRTVKVEIGQGFCSGVIVHTNLVLTAKHCVEGKTQWMINGEVATVNSVSASVDLALLNVSTSKFNWVKLGDVEQTDRIEIWGYQRTSDELSYFTGTVVAIESGWTLAQALLIPGNSGGGVWRGHKLVGICSQSYQPSGGTLIRAVPAKDIKEFLGGVK